MSHIFNQYIYCLKHVCHLANEATEKYQKPKIFCRSVPLQRFTVHQFHTMWNPCWYNTLTASQILNCNLTDDSRLSAACAPPYIGIVGGLWKVIAWLNTGAHWLGPWACPVDMLHMHLLGEMHGYITISNGFHH